MSADEPPFFFWPRPVAAAYAALCLVATAALLLLILPAMKQAEIDDWGRALSAMADDRVGGVNHIITDAFADAAAIADYPSVLYVANERRSGPTPFPVEIGAAAHLNELFLIHAKTDGDENLLLFDRRGRLEARAKRSERDERLARTIAAQVIRTGKQHGDVGFERDTAFLYFGVPVRGATGAPVGAIVLVTNPTASIFSVVTRSTNSHTFTETIIGKQVGETYQLFSPLKKRRDAGVSRDQGTAIAAALRGELRVGDFTDYNGDPVLAAVRPIQSMGWGIVVKADQKTVLASYNRNAAIVILIVVGVLLLLAAVVHILCMRQAIERARIQVTHDEERRRAEAELKRGYELLTAITESTPDSIFAKDRAGKYIFINAAGAREYGMSPGQIVGHSDEELYPADAAAQFLEADREVMQHGQPVTLEQSGQIFGNEHVWLVNKAPMRDAAGEVIGVIGISRDITQKKATEAAIRQTEERFHSLFEHAPIGVVVCNPQGELTDVNSAFAAMIGYTRREMVGRNLVEFAPPEDRQRQQQWLMEALQPGRKVFRRDKRYQRKDGGIVWVHASGSLIRTDEGTPGYFMIGLMDITERRDSQQALKASEERFRTLYETMSQGVMYFSHSGDLLNANPAAERILGMRVTDRKDKEAQVLRADGSVMPPDEYPSRVAALTQREVVDQLIAVYNEVEQQYRWLLVSARPTAIADEAIPGLVCSTFTDVTALRNTENALRDAEQSSAHANERIQRILDVNIVGVVITKADGTIVEGNDYYLETIGYSRDDLTQGRVKWTDITPPEHLESDRRALEELMEDGVSKPYEKEYIRKDGTRVWVLMGNALLPGPEPQFLGWVINIAAQKELHLQFQQAQKMEAIGRLAGGVAHDFNNILTAIRGLADIVITDMDTSADSYADVQEIICSSDRATALTRQLLAFSRRQMLQPRNVDLVELVDGIQRMLRRLIGEDIEVEVQRPDRPLYAFADPGQIEQVVLNLAVNARDAMPKGGRLSIAVTEAPRALVREHGHAPEGRFVALTVTDTGCGMNDDTLGKIFEPFFTTKDVGKGTGLGLATVYGIVRQSGGWINVSSEVGIGTTFNVYLPQGESHAGEVRAGRRASPERSGATILLVEDEDSVRNVARRILMRRGHHVLEAPNATEALHVAEHHQGIDMIITDILMPGMSGPELVDRLRVLRPGTKAILMSGYSREALPAEFATDLSAIFLEKPFSPDALLQKIDSLLATV